MATTEPRRRTTADRIAAGFARWVAGSSDKRLESVMRSPVRSTMLNQIFRAMPAHLDRERAASLNTVVEFRIGGRRGGGHDRYQVAFADGRCSTSKGGERKPAFALTVSGTSFLRLVAGSVTAMDLMGRGALGVEGDITVGMQLMNVFRIPTPPSASATQA